MVTCRPRRIAALAREWHAFAGCRVETSLREELPFIQ